MVCIGIIGLGGMGRVHYNVYRQLPEARIVAVCDVDPRRAKGDLSEAWGNIVTEGNRTVTMDQVASFTDYHELLAAAEVEMVDVCLPTPLHAEVVTAALAAGKHVLCEKPLARTVAEARLVAAAAAAAAERGKFFMPAMCMRFWSEWEWLRRITAEQHYGRIKSALFRRLGSIPAGWFAEGHRSGGAMLDLHIHDVDYIQHLLGKPHGVFARGAIGASGQVDHVMTQYLYDAATLVCAEGSWTMTPGFGFRMHFEVVFERATVDFDLGRKPTLMLYADGKSEPVAHDEHDGYLGEISYFLECVKTRQKPQRVTADDAVLAMQIIDAELKSIATGQMVVV